MCGGPISAQNARAVCRVPSDRRAGWRGVSPGEQQRLPPEQYNGLSRDKSGMTQPAVRDTWYGVAASGSAALASVTSPGRWPGSSNDNRQAGWVFGPRRNHQSGCGVAVGHGAHGGRPISSARQNGPRPADSSAAGTVLRPQCCGQRAVARRRPRSVRLSSAGGSRTTARDAPAPLPPDCRSAPGS